MIAAWIAALTGLALFAAEVVPLALRARRRAALADEIARDGVEVSVDGDVVLEDRVGGLRSPGFALKTPAGERIEVAPDTAVVLATSSLALPHGTRLCMLDRTRTVSGEGPMRTAGQRELDQAILIAHVDPALRDHRAGEPSWLVAIAIAACFVLIALFSPALGGTAPLVLVALVLAWDLVRNDRELVRLLLARRRQVDSPAVRRGHQIAAGLGLATAGAALAALAWLMPQLPPWTQRHAAIAPLDRVDPALEGRIVTVTGPLESDERVADPELLLPADELVLERNVEREKEVVHGKTGRRMWMWNASEVADLSSRQWRVGRARVGAYELDLTGAQLPRAPELAIDVRRLRPRPLGTLGWSQGRHGYYGEHARIVFAGHRIGTWVTVLATQRGSRLTPIPVASDGATGVIVALGVRPGDDSVFDAWPRSRSGSTLVCAMLVVCGILGAFARLRDTLLAFVALAVILGLGVITGGLVIAATVAIMVVLLGFWLATLPRSILVLLTAVSALAAQLAIVEATELPALGYAAAAAIVVILAVLRRGFGWHRTISWT